jgi:putative protease
VIVSDPGVIYAIQQLSTNVKIHLSTQANTTNSDAVKFWQGHDVKRFVLARELSLEQITKIKENVPTAEIEIFVHGAMCISYSGRCLLSKAMTGRSANRGDCAQPCRWEYQMREVNRDEEMTMVQDGRGSYVLNSKDLCMINHIPEMVKAGVGSFKIEGRMKSAYYVALVTKIYRQAIDAYCADPENYQVLPQWQEELTNVSHRRYTTGFYFRDNEMEYLEESGYIKKYDFAGKVVDFDQNSKKLTIAVRNKISAGDFIDIIDPHELEIKTIKIDKMLRDNGLFVSDAHNSYTVSLDLQGMAIEKITKDSIIRKKK